MQPTEQFNYILKSFCDLVIIIWKDLYENLGLLYRASHFEDPKEILYNENPIKIK